MPVDTTSDSLPPRPRRQARRDSRGELLDAALDIILTRGIDALKIEDVCERVGVTKGSLYWHFNDREGLIREALLEHLYRINDEQTAVLDQAIDTANSCDEQLTKVAGWFVDPFDATQVEHRWQRMELLTTTRRDPELAAVSTAVGLGASHISLLDPMPPGVLVEQSGPLDKRPVTCGTVCATTMKP